MVLTLVTAAKPKSREFAFKPLDFEFLRRIVNQRTRIIIGDDEFDRVYAHLAPRLRALRIESFRDYCDYLQGPQGERECHELINAITVSPTVFFRENRHFDYLARQMAPEWLATGRGDRQIRIWSAGCSTGEEAYSIAIALLEVLPADWTPQIIATDIDGYVLDVAKQGRYDLDRLQGVSASRLKRWFLHANGADGGKVEVAPELRDVMVFRQLNLIDDFSLEPLDAIFCRNVFTYLDRTAKARLAERFADQLGADGCLFIGPSESLFKISDRFELIGHTVYRKVR